MGGEVMLGGRVVRVHSNERLPGAVVVLRCGETVREAHADSVGAFVFHDVQPGACTLQVLVGLANRTSELTLRSGERRMLDVAVDPERKPTIDPALREQALRDGDSVKVRPRRRE